MIGTLFYTIEVLLYYYLDISCGVEQIPTPSLKSDQSDGASFHFRAGSEQ